MSTKSLTPKRQLQIQFNKVTYRINELNNITTDAEFREWNNNFLEQHIMVHTQKMLKRHKCRDRCKINRLMVYYKTK